ncbi:MAG TPA: hypothetical protein VNK43_07680 [Gemmatimonadales bacterium]|nr:hypothetical protein [Gemmatimonadales bacterium]
MRSFLRSGGGWRAVVGALALWLAAPVPGDAEPAPGRPRRGFRLFAHGPNTQYLANRVNCGLANVGNICVDIGGGSSTGGGGFWPRGTANQYVFNSGIQLAGIVGPDGGSWAGDTVSAALFDASGFFNHGEGITNAFNSNDPEDVEAWPDAALVPQGDANELLFHPVLRGRLQASQGDAWFLTSDANPARNSGRPHPMGVVVEHRALAWNYPSGNEDIIYFLYTFYNITSIDPASYAGVRPALRELLLAEAQRFQQRNEANFGVEIPDGGYTIVDAFAAFAADMDVANAGQNYASVNVPFALGYSYQNDFGRPATWTFDPTIFGPPFFPGVGFVGVKYLKSPEIAPGVQAGLTLYSNTSNAGTFSDPANTQQLYRYLSGTVSPAFGDQPCNTGNPRVTRICFINNTAAFDMRFFQSSGPLTIPPGGFSSIVVAYIFAAPVATGTATTAPCPGGAGCDIRPGDPTRLSNPATADNANPIDSIAGFTGYRGDVDGDGVADQEEFTLPVPGSLYGKALVAQAVFDSQFLLPFAPEAPEFFLVPGDGQVTVLWRPSVTETDGDPFFTIAGSPTTDGSPNPLFDPNYRQFDVEGYRVYRGRVDNPSELTLLAQFDYSGTFMRDFRGTVNPVPGCAPEVGIRTDCPVPFDSTGPGVAPTQFVDVPLTGPISQVKIGERQALVTGQAVLLSSDTALTGRGAVGGPFPELEDTGVPFIYVDRTARNNIRYFYSVTAFDINSFQSGPSTLESARRTKAVTPAHAAPNFASSGGVVSTTVAGRGGALDTARPLPTLDPATGRFSGPFPPAGAWQIGFAASVTNLLGAEGSFSVRLDSIQLGSNRDAIPHLYWFTSLADNSTFSVPVGQTEVGDEATGSSQFPGARVDPELAARYGGNADFTLPGQVSLTLPGNRFTSSYGRGCVNAPTTGFPQQPGCEYNGPRWFAGPSPETNETKDHPNEGNPAIDATNFVGTMTNFNNAGELPGVTVIHHPLSYVTMNNDWREVENVLGGAARAADFNVYWGAGGAIDSVIDVTHGVPVPFDSVFAGSWGILNQGATAAGGSVDQRPNVLTLADMGCVEPLRSYAGPQAVIPCTSPAPFRLSRTAVLGPISFFTGGAVADQSPISPVAPQPGFLLYVSGYEFLMQMPALPAAGTVWALRTYVGSINGGVGSGGDFGPYSFFAQPRPLAVPGAVLSANFAAQNQVRPATEADLARVHTVPDPYYVTNQFERSTDTKVLKFVNLPAQAIIRIYSSSGVLVTLLEHPGASCQNVGLNAPGQPNNPFGGECTWNVRNRNNQVVASGVYFYHIESGDARRAGRFTVVNFAQ